MLKIIDFKGLLNRIEIVGRLLTHLFLLMWPYLDHLPASWVQNDTLTNSQNLVIISNENILTTMIFNKINVQYKLAIIMVFDRYGSILSIIFISS